MGPVTMAPSLVSARHCHCVHRRGGLGPVVCNVGGAGGTRPADTWRPREGGREAEGGREGGREHTTSKQRVVGKHRTVSSERGRGTRAQPVCTAHVVKCVCVCMRV